MPAPAVLFGRYLPVKSFRGGMGTVQLCADLAERRPIALKTFLPELLADVEAREQFIREAALWLELGTHPHLVTAHQVRRDAEQVFVVADYITPVEGCPNPSLRCWLGAPLPPARALGFALGITRGMLWATARVPGMAHCDLKPENVLVGRDYRAKVTDFGLARVRGQTGDCVCGTPRYMAPEQWRGQADTRSDIYAFGLILLEMLAGSSLMVAGDISAMRAAHLAGAPAGRARGVPLPPALRALVEAAVDPDPARRPQNWEIIEQALIGAWSEVAGGAAPELPPPEPATQQRRVLEAWSQNALANALAELGHVGDAVAGYRALLPTARSLDEPALEAGILNNLGQALTVTGDLEAALSAIEASLVLKRKLGDRHGEATSLNSRANLNMRRNGLGQALADQEAALALLAQTGPVAEQCRTRMNMVPVLMKLGQHARALELARESREAFRSLGDVAGEGIALGTLGQLLRHAGALDEALQCSRQALECFRARGDRLAEARELSFQGHTLRGMNRNREALECFEASLASSQALGDSLLSGSNFYALAQMTPPLAQFAPLGRRNAELAAAAYRKAGREDLARDADALMRSFGAGG
jgi:tetratricopeptide (TPR) repeat protein